MLNKLMNRLDPANRPQHDEHQAVDFPLTRADNPLPVYPQPDLRPPGPGQLPPKAHNVTYTDRHRFYHTNGKEHLTSRDAGFTGILDGRIVWIWADTCMGAGPSMQLSACDAMSIGSMNDPMHSVDVHYHDNNAHVKSVLECTSAENADGGYGKYAFWPTNIVEVSPNKGIFFYEKLKRPFNMLSTGVATVSLDKRGRPVVKRPFDTLWTEAEPAYGATGIALDKRDGHIYAYGRGANNHEDLACRTYLCKVPAGKALDINAYQYWDNEKRHWVRERFPNGQFGTVQHTKEQAIFDWHCVGMSAPFWSNYYNKWMWLQGTSFPASHVMCMTADHLEGPWQDFREIATLPEIKDNPQLMRYCVCPHPEFDPSGKTILVTWSHHPDEFTYIIYGMVIEWE